MGAVKVTNPDGTDYLKNGKPVYAYYLNELDSGALTSPGLGGGTLPMTGGHDADVSFDQMIVVAGEVKSPDAEGVVTENVRLVARKKGLFDEGAGYDLGAAQRIEHWDVGLVEVPRSSITGTVWNDENYDGIMDEDEAGLVGETVAVEQYYYKDGTWVRNDRFGDDERTSVRANWKTEVRKNVQGIDETWWLREYTDAAGQKVPVEMKAETDSDGNPLLDAEGNVAEGATYPSGETAEDGKVLVHTDENGVYTFDNLPTAYTDGDGAHYLAAYRVVLVGLHSDKVYDEDDPTKLLYETPWMMTHYHQGDDVLGDSDVRDDQGLRQTTYPVIGREVEGADGAGTTQLRALDGQIILADTVKTGRENSYQPSQIEVNRGDVYEGATGTVQYDYLTVRAAEVQGGDVGEVAVPRREVNGRVWHDEDYDGVQDFREEDEPLLDENNQPVKDAEGNPVTQKVKVYDEPGIEGEAVTLSQWYFDPAAADGAGAWVRNEQFCRDGFNMLAAVATDDWAVDETDADALAAALSDDGYVTLTTNGDGEYSFKNLPTAYVSADGKLYLASYRLTAD